MSSRSSDEVLRLVGVTCEVGDRAGMRRVVDRVDLTVRAGEKVAIVGRSGAGKSTLLNVAGLLASPAAGQVWLRGERVDALRGVERDARRAGGVGFVFQSLNLVPHLTVRHNLRLGSPARRLTAQEVDGALSSVGLDAGQVGDQRAARLSLGEQQRVAVARALVKRPALVLADEPTGSLDEESEKSVLGVLEAAVVAGSAVVVVTHADRVAGWADRVLTLAGGGLSHGMARA